MQNYKIVSLKQEVVELKEEINEIVNKSDTVDLNVKFKLLPISISDSQENRKWFGVNYNIETGRRDE